MKAQDYRQKLAHTAEEEIYEIGIKSGYIAFSKDSGKELKRIIRKQYGSIRSLAECLSCVTDRETHTEQVYISNLINGKMFRSSRYSQYRSYVRDIFDLLENDEEFSKESMMCEILFGFIPPEKGRIPLEDFLVSQEN